MKNSMIYQSHYEFPCKNSTPISPAKADASLQEAKNTAAQQQNNFPGGKKPLHSKGIKGGCGTEFYSKTGILFVCLLFCPLVFGIKINNLYDVEIDAPDRSSDARKIIFEQALDMVILKVSGQKFALNSSEMFIAKKQIDKYISQYSYKEREEQLKLEISFNEKMVDYLLKQIGQPFLGRDRPLVIMWLIIDSTQEQKVLGSGSATHEVELFEKLVKARGVPIIFPLLDLRESSIVNNKDILNFSISTLERASKPYQADLIFVGKITKFAGQWQGECKLFGEKISGSVSKGDYIQEQIEHMVQFLAEELVIRYGVISSPIKDRAYGKVRVRVQGINSLENYAKVSDYLKGLSVSKQVEVDEILENEVIFFVQAEGGQSSIVKSINLDRVLKRLPTQEYEQGDIKYRINS